MYSNEKLRHNYSNITAYQLTLQNKGTGRCQYREKFIYKGGHFRKSLLTATLKKPYFIFLPEINYNTNNKTM